MNRTMQEGYTKVTGEIEDSLLVLKFLAYILNTHCPKSMQYIRKQNINKYNILVTTCKTKATQSYEINLILH